MAQQLVAVHPVRDGLEQHQEAHQRDQLDARRAAQRTGAAGQPDAAEQVVTHQVGDERQERRREQKAQHQPVERQIERVEAEVLAELGVSDAEAAAVDEQLDALPVGLGDEAGDDADERGHADADQPQPGHHRGAVAGHRIVGAAGRNEHRPGAVRQGERGEHDAAHHHRRHQEDDELGDQRGGEHRAVAELAEPQPVHVFVDHPRPEQQQQHDGQGDRDQNPATSCQLRHSCRGPHTHSSTPVLGSQTSTVTWPQLYAFGARQPLSNGEVRHRRKLRAARRPPGPGCRP